MLEINCCVSFFGLEIWSLDPASTSLLWMIDIFFYIFLFITFNNVSENHFSMLLTTLYLTHFPCALVEQNQSWLHQRVLRLPRAMRDNLT